MKSTRLRLVLALLLLCTSGFTASQPGMPPGAEEPLQENAPPLRWMLRFAPQAGEAQSASQALQTFAEQGLKAHKYLPQIQVWVVEPGDALDLDAPQGAERLRQQARLEWIEQDGWLYASDIAPNDPYYLPQQANLRLIGLPWAWAFTTGSADWPIAVIDTGIDMDHPDLAAKLWVNAGEIPDNGLDDDLNGYVDDIYGWNFVADTPTPQDDQSHGSHVSGIAAAQTNNAIGIAGVAWGTPVMALKALKSTGGGSASDVAEAILYAADNGARILNLSFGSSQEFQAISQAIDYARGRGCLVIAAAGNTGGAVEYPAAQPGVIAVAATDNLDQVASFSNRGPQVALAAPGVDIFSANRTGFYFLGSGTSASTPHVSGLAALIWDLHPDWSADQVTQVITSTALDLWSPGRDNLTGWGRIDAQAAVFASLEHLYLPCLYSDFRYEIFLSLILR